MTCRSPHSKLTIAGLLALSMLLVITTALLPLAANAAPAARPAADALCDDAVGYWTLDETSGDRLDGKGVNDLIESTTVDYATGKIDNAASFAGGTNLYHDGNPTLETGDIDFTITAWVYFESQPEDGTWSPIVSRLDTNAGEYELFAYTNQNFTAFGFHLYKPDGSLLTYKASNLQMTPGNWYFLVAWHDSGANGIGLRVNNLTGFTSGAYTGSQMGAADTRFIIGADDKGSGFLEGRVDEVGFWKRLLTTGEKNTLYNNGAGYDPITCGATATPTLSPTPGALVEISKNYIRQGSFEFPSLMNSAWDMNITNSSVRQMLGMGLPPVPGQAAALWEKLAEFGAGCGADGAVVLANSPQDDSRSGNLSQDFQWPGGSMYLSFLGKTSENTKGSVTVTNEDTGAIVPVDPNFTNPSIDWVVARYVYNLVAGNYRLTYTAIGPGGSFGWLAVDDVNVRQGYWLNECFEKPAPGLIPAQQSPYDPTPFPWTPGAAPTQWLPYPSVTPLAPPASVTAFPFITVAVTPIAPPPDYNAGTNILRNGSFESFFNFLYWTPSRWSQVVRIGGIENRAYVGMDMGLQPPALSQHFDMRANEPAYVSFWANSDSHMTVAIREAPTGIFKAIMRVDTAPNSGWTKHEFSTPVLAIGQYSIEITNIFQQNGQVDEVAVTVSLPYAYPAYYPGIENAAPAQASATAYVDYIGTYNALHLQTANAQATQDVYDDQTQVAAMTRFAQTQAVATSQSLAQTQAAQSYWATQTRQAQINGAAQTATAFWLQLYAAQTQLAATAIAQTQVALRSTQTAQANQTQIWISAQQTIAAIQTEIFLTQNSPIALTQTAQSIIVSAQAPWYATQTALAAQLTATALQATATAQGTPPLPTPTVDALVLTQQALFVPDQPEPYWSAVCGRPPNSINLAWWIDYEVCRILSWFAWSPVNTAHVQTWLIQIGQYEPFGTIREVASAFTALKEIISAYDWNHTGADCTNMTPNLTDLLPPASGILTGNFQFIPGDPIDMNCNIPIRSVVGDGIANGICGSLSILCQHGLLAWMQYIFDALLIVMFILYIQAVWIEKATQG